MWAALCSEGVIGPFFYLENGETTTVNSERYLCLQKTKFMPALRRKSDDLQTVWFQQDGAAPHTSFAVLDWLKETFGDRLISYRTDRVWPPHSPDLNPLDFFLWGFLKDKVYNPKPQTLDELKRNIKFHIRRVSAEVCDNVVNNFRKRLSLVVKRDGGHIEHLTL